MSVLLGYPLADLVARGAGDTAREIAQQPALWREIAALAPGSLGYDTALLDHLLERPELRIVLAGAGSSSFAGQVLAPVLARELGRRVDAIATTDIVSNPREYLAEDVPSLLVSFARSGDSPESIAATELADRRLSECFHLVVTCNRDGELARHHGTRSRSGVLLLPAAANDRGFAMTSSFTGMMLAARVALDHAFGDHVVNRLAAAAEHVLDTRMSDAASLAARGYTRIVYLGSGALKGLANESALKAVELTAGGVVALSDSTLGFRHGPKAVLDERTLVVVYVSNDPYTRRYDLDVVAELRQSLPPGDLVTIAAGSGTSPGERAWQLPGLENVDDSALALPAVVHAQLIAVQLSLELGCTPDNPFPSGEVNRVVHGVTVHPFPG